MKISLVTTTKNRPQQLLEAGLSVATQKVLPHQWIIFIDDDFDKYKYTVKILCKILPKSLLTVQCKPNTGRVTSLIEAHKLVTGDYIGLLDDDDSLDTECIYRCSRGVSEVIYTDFWEVRENKARVSKVNQTPYDYATLFKNNIIFHFKLYSKRLYNLVGGYDETFDTSMDYELSLRLLKHAQPEKINHPLYYYQMRGDRISSRQGIRQRENAQRARDKNRHLLLTSDHSRHSYGLD